MSAKGRGPRGPKATRKKGRSKADATDRQDNSLATRQAEMLLWWLIYIYETEGADAAKRALLARVRKRRGS